MPQPGEKPTKEPVIDLNLLRPLLIRKILIALYAGLIGLDLSLVLSFVHALLSETLNFKNTYSTRYYVLLIPPKNYPDSSCGCQT